MLQRLDVKLVLAAISGALVGLHFNARVDEEQLGRLLVFLNAYGVPGVLFAIPILSPYLRRNDHFLPRGLALIAASMLSYWCARSSLDIVEGSTFGSSDVMLFIVASIIGAGIVFLAAKYIVPFNWSKRYLLLGLLAAVVGGWAFDALQNAPGPDMIFSFIAWHCIVCAALHFGTQRNGETSHA